MLIRNNLPPSKYCHWDYSLFKDIKPYDIKNKKRGFLEFIGNTRYVQKGNTTLLYKLVDYYLDLDKILQRILDGYYDEMFMRFAFWAKVFGTEQRFTEFLQLWEDFFQEALEVYLKKHHEAYDESYGISYVSYFNLKFSQCLSYACVPVFSRYGGNSKNTPPYYRYLNNVETFSFYDCSNLLVCSPLEYPRENYYQELIYQSFSP